MNDITAFQTYGEYKQILDRELQESAEGFVRIGYLLKQARDTDILKESGYKNYVEFAQAEYNIDKTMVSRFIRINDKFAENGNSDQLQEQFRGFGYAKLTLMLQLPDEVNNILTPDFSKSEIQAVKEELDAENKVSDLEVMMEEKGVEVNLDSMFAKAMHKLLQDEPEKYVELFKVPTVGTGHDTIIKLVSNILAPSGIKVDTVRIPGIGRLMISYKGTEHDIETVNVRSGEKESCTWEKAVEDIMSMMVLADSPEESWEETYGDLFPRKEEPKKPEVAPVQPKKESKVTKAKVEEKPKTEKKVIKTEESVPKQQENVIESQETVHKQQENAQILETAVPINEPEVLEMMLEVEGTAETQQNQELAAENAAEERRAEDGKTSEGSDFADAGKMVEDDHDGKNTETVKEAAGQQEPQLPGQMSVVDYPEILPADYEERWIHFQEKVSELYDKAVRQNSRDAGEVRAICEEVVGHLAEVI